jgi:hypothetical protein
LIQGSLHRGFLNAYSRVERGSILRLSSKSKYNNNASSSYTRKEKKNKKKKKKKRRLSSLPHIIDGLHKRFGRCTADYMDYNNNDDNENEEKTMDSNNIPPLDKKRQRNKKKSGGGGRGGGCRFTKKGEEIPLSIVLKELVNNALKNGYTVHVTGHSLGGALATLLVLDVLVNNDDNDKNNPIDIIPTSNLHLWTFGAPQVADSLFLESLANSSKKLRNFLGIIGMDDKSNRRRQRQRQRKHNHNHRKQFHRFVTLSDDGKVDVVSEVAKTALAAHKELEYFQEEDKLSTTTTTTTTTTKGAADTDTNTNTDNTDDDTIQNNKNDNVGTTTNKKKKKKKKKRSRKSIRSKRKWLRTHLWHGKVARSLGGVSGGGHYVTHFIEPHYLWTPDQYQRHHHYYYDQEHHNNNNMMSTTTAATTGGSTTSTTPTSTSTSTDSNSSSNTRSSVAAHSMSNYLIGISREACSSSTRSTNDKCNPLIPDVPTEWLEYLDINSYYVGVLSSTVI